MAQRSRPGDASNVAMATIGVANYAPVAVNDPWYSVAHDTALAVADPNSGLLANDYDLDDPATNLTVATVGAAGHAASLQVNPDGTFTYTPEPGWVGQDTFNYTITDGIDQSTPAAVAINVYNSPPVASPIDDIYHWAHNPEVETVSLWDYFADPDDTDQQLTYSVVNSNPTAVVDSFDAGSGVLTLSFTGYAGVADISVRATDRVGEYDETSLTVYAVDATGYQVEARSWGEDTWRTVPGNEVLWADDEHRWTALYEPLAAAPAIEEIIWMVKPWEFRDDDIYPWEAFTSAPGEAQAFGTPSLGDWAVTPLINFAGAVARMVSPGHEGVCKISKVEWVGVDPGDGQTNFEGNRIFPERNHPLGTPDPNDPTKTIDQVHDRIDVRVTITPAIPGPKSGTIYLKVFDPDHYQDGGAVDTPQDGDPNDHDPATHSPDDNVKPGTGLAAGTGMSPGWTSLVFSPGDTEKTAEYTIDWPQPGNNYIVGAHHRDPSLRSYRFKDDGHTLYLMDKGEVVDVAAAFRTPELDVWRTLWMELDDMVAPDPAAAPAGDGPFDGAGMGNDDVELDPPPPPTGLVESSMPAARIEVRTLPAEYDLKNDAVFIHNMYSGSSTTVRTAVRDVDSERKFWVVNVVGGYEHEQDRDYDDESLWSLGWAFQPGADGVTLVFFETIRDRQVNDPAGPPDPVAESVLQQRVVLHESLHRFLGVHGNPGADEGIMDVDTVLYGSDSDNVLTPRQIQVIQKRDYSR